MQDGIVRIEVDGGFFGLSSSQGSGFIFAIEETTAFVATNHHVIEDADSISVTVRSGQTYEALLLGWDADRDVAVLAICCAYDFVALPWEPATASVGAQVVAIGYSQTGFTVTIGKVVAPDAPSKEYDLIPHSAPLNPGNSGGPLFLMPGARVLGINTARGTETLSFYAVPYQAIEEPMKEWRSQIVILPAPSPTPTIIFEAVEAGGSSYTVNEIRDPAPVSRSLDIGKRLVAVDITQVGLEDGVSHSPRNFSVQDSEGYVYDRSGSTELDPSFGSGELSAGQRVRGWVTFVVPELATLASIMVEPNYSSPKVVIADLTRRP